MKYWYIPAIAVLAIVILLFAPLIARAAAIWPHDLPRPLLHYACGKTQGQVMVRVELGQYVTKDYLIECGGT